MPHNVGMQQLAAAPCASPFPPEPEKLPPPNHPQDRHFWDQMYMYLALIPVVSAVQHGCPPLIIPLPGTVLAVTTFAAQPVTSGHAHVQVQMNAARIMTNPFASLPVEVVEEILGHLEPEQVYGMRTWSSLLHGVATSRALWMSFVNVQRAEAASSVMFGVIPQGMHPCHLWFKRKLQHLNVVSGLEAWLTNPKPYYAIREYGTLTMAATADAAFEPGPTCVLPMPMNAVIELCHALSKVRVHR